MCELTDEDSVARQDGIIALQIHAGQPMKVQFRNIRLKELPKQASRCGTMRGTRKIVFLAGPPSHGYAEHEYHAGCLLLAKCLPGGPAGRGDRGRSETVGRKIPKALDDADAIVLFVRRRRRRTPCCPTSTRSADS